MLASRVLSPLGIVALSSAVPSTSRGLPNLKSCYAEKPMRTIERSVLFAIFLRLWLSPLARKTANPASTRSTLTTTTVAPSATTYPPRTMHACLTPEMIEKYGAIVPETPIRACQFVNITKRPGGTTADFTCSGPINGSGKLEVNWTDSEHSKGNLHFSGTIRPGDNEIKIEWNAATASVYKGPDCGAVRPTPPSPAPQPAAPPAAPKPE